MSATVFSTSKYGLNDETSSTGLIAANVSFAASSEQAMLPNHIGQDVGMSIYNESIEVTISGVLAIKGDGFVSGIADVVTLANTDSDGLNIPDNLLKVAPIEGAGIIITGATLSRTNTGFETGDITAIFKPGIDASSSTPVT